MTAETRPDWRGLTEQIRVWQRATFPAVTEEVGKWRTVNELAELGKKIASGAPIAEIHEEAADVIITMQHCRPAVSFDTPSQNLCTVSHATRASWGTRALIEENVELAFYHISKIFPTEAAAFAEVERKFAENLKRIWIIQPDGSGQHQELSPAEVKLGKIRELCDDKAIYVESEFYDGMAVTTYDVRAILDGQTPVDGGADG